jgi:hypothetical protein
VFRGRPEFAALVRTTSRLQAHSHDFRMATPYAFWSCCPRAANRVSSALRRFDFMGVRSLFANLGRVDEFDQAKAGGETDD